jgi:hypothetical protein
VCVCVCVSVCLSVCLSESSVGTVSFFQSNAKGGPYLYDDAIHVSYRLTLWQYAIHNGHSRIILHYGNMLYTMAIHVSSYTMAICYTQWPYTYRVHVYMLTCICV